MDVAGNKKERWRTWALEMCTGGEGGSSSEEKNYGEFQEWGFTLCGDNCCVSSGEGNGSGVDVAVLLGEKWQRPTGTRSVG